MRLTLIPRVLTPLGWACLILGVAVVVLALAQTLALALGSGLGQIWDPLSHRARNAEITRQRADSAEAEAMARQLEQQALQQQVQRLEALERVIGGVRQETAKTIQIAKEAHDADNKIESGRLDRLRAHDRQLCQARLALSGCPTPDDAS